ncbi:MAG: Fur family transcriptional regulator [Thiobacillaceae bacterium]
MSPVIRRGGEDPAIAAEALVRRYGRATPARVAVLRLLLTADSALTHAEVAARLGGGVDRVTLYRVLDWLVSRGLAHRIAGEDRIWRFGVNVARATTMHPSPAGGEAGGEGTDAATPLPRGGVAMSVGAVAAHGGHEHAHFLCEGCGRAFCLNELRPVVALSLPPGFRCRAAALTLHGLCPRCGEDRKSTGQRP